MFIWRECDRSLEQARKSLLKIERENERKRVEKTRVREKRTLFKHKRKQNTLVFSLSIERVHTNSKLFTPLPFPSMDPLAPSTVQLLLLDWSTLPRLPVRQTTTPTLTLD